ncbi:MAG: DeoR family transcriptional regulator [Parcubacteria group bacterium]
MDQERKNQNDLSHNIADPVSFFGNDSGFVYIFKKTEKLATAVYMVTSLLSDNEPMKWSLRRKVSDLLSLVVNYKDIPESARFDFVYNIKTSVLEMTSFLETLSLGGSISKMNSSVLKQEFLNLVNFMDSGANVSGDLSRHVFSDTFFDVPKIEKSAFKDTPQNPHASAVNSYSYLSIPANQTSQSTRDNTPKEKDLFKRSNRQNIIIGLLKKKKELTIKDIAQTIKDCSEKTIQRELISLIGLGLLKRTGERRWSKYSLVPEKINS